MENGAFAPMNQMLDFQKYFQIHSISKVSKGLIMRRSRNFCQGGPGPMARKQHGQNFFGFVFSVLNLFYSLQRVSNGFITEKLCFSKDPEGVQNFPGV